VEHLGFTIDFKQGCLQVPQEKLKAKKWRYEDLPPTQPCHAEKWLQFWGPPDPF
jgi:hypothetical protein